MWCTTSPIYIKVGLMAKYYANLKTLSHLSFLVLRYSRTCSHLSHLPGSIPSVGRRDKASSGSPGEMFSHLQTFPQYFFFFVRLFTQFVFFPAPHAAPTSSATSLPFNQLIGGAVRHCKLSFNWKENDNLKITWCMLIVDIPWHKCIAAGQADLGKVFNDLV